jgi:Mor family transcriptional regulator
MRVKNSTLNILFTISPVRHTKDGIQNNQVSKSILRLAVEQLTHLFSNAYYFPAYEYVLDELRDYRFFKKDLIHPNDIAEEFIYEKMKRHLFEEALLEASIDSEKLEKRNNHRKLNAI